MTDEPNGAEGVAVHKKLIWGFEGSGPGDVVS